MGNYLSQSPINEMETLLKDLIYELEIYITKDGFKPYTLKSAEMQGLTDLEYNLKTISSYLRKVYKDNQPLDKTYIDEIIKENATIIEKYPNINEYSLKDKIERIVFLLA
jgi:hypothetical protein